MSLPLYTEYAVDPTQNRFLERNGEYVKIQGTEAVKQWVIRGFKPDCKRYLYPAHTKSYGHSFEDFIGRAMSQNNLALIRSAITDMLYANPYISKITDYDISIQGCQLKINLTVQTIYDTFNLQEVYNYERL